MFRLEKDKVLFDYIAIAPHAVSLVLVGKLRPRLIDLTSFKPKLLIKFIINKTF